MTARTSAGAGGQDYKPLQMRGASGEPGVIDKADVRPPAGERTKLRRGAAAVRIQYRAGSGEAIDTTLDRVKLDELTKGLPVREFRWYRGRMHYSGWYWSSITTGLVAYESRLELARIWLGSGLTPRHGGADGPGPGLWQIRSLGHRYPAAGPTASEAPRICGVFRLRTVPVPVV